ncbi:sec-independent protein translocase protein TatB [Sphingomonas jinjuensis]|uniref:Sec-independent protein translocase protein TatB n=1 Tax=Sphingomonas jinjuensis TaxID=535907 RepID=A0A840F8Q7_9SPHN|nr:sec-independent protein translocase protein TatB [Sphingomonas jinjuensis]
MFGIDSSEFLLVAFVALVVIGPKDLPKAMRVVGYWVGRARAVSRQFRQGFDNMVREAELEEMEKRWAAENARIMAEHPASTSDAAPSTEAAPTDTEHEAVPVMTDKPIMVDHPVVEPSDADRPAPPREGASS